MSGNQESISGGGRVSLDCYHSKLYTTDSAVVLHLDNGLQDGQLKKFTFVFKGTSEGNVTVQCPSLMGINSEIVFSNVGDNCVLLWTGGTWCVLETGNTVDPTQQSPVVQ
jgi:hypothetical protein